MATGRGARVRVLGAAGLRSLDLCWHDPSAQAARNKVVKLVVDGKQKVLTNDYAIVTVSFLVPSETVSKKWVGRTHTASAELNAATQQPFLQALVNTESEENILHVFNTAHDLGQKYCDLDLRNQVLQVHKDFAKGNEALEGKRFQRRDPVTTMCAHATCVVQPVKVVAWREASRAAASIAG